MRLTDEIQYSNNTIEKRDETIIILKKTGKVMLVFFLGTGKIIASAALLQQNVLGTLSNLKVSKNIGIFASVTCALSNGISNGITRYPAIDDKLFSPDISPIEVEILTSKQYYAAGFVKALGRGSLAFMSMNTQSAVQDALYYYTNLNNQHKKPFSYKDDWWMVALAGLVTLSGAVSYIAFNFKRIDSNAIKFAQKIISKDVIKNIYEIDRNVLIPLTIMTVINILPNMGGNYYPTLKALTNFFGEELVGEWYIQALLYSSLICGFSSNLFSMVGESFNFLTNDQKSRILKWMRNPLCYVIATPIIIDIIANGFGGYIANLEMINDFTNHTNSSSIKIEIATSITSAIFSFISTIFYALYQAVPAFDVVTKLSCCIALSCYIQSEYKDINAKLAVEHTVLITDASITQLEKMKMSQELLNEAPELNEVPDYSSLATVDFTHDTKASWNPEKLAGELKLSPEEMGKLDVMLAYMGVKKEEIPGNIITFLAMIGQGLFGGELAFKYLKLGLQSFCNNFMTEKNAEITADAIAGCAAIIITAAVIWGKYKLVRSFNRGTLTWEGLKNFFTLEHKWNTLDGAKERGKVLLKLPFVLVASAVFAGLNGVSLDGFSALLLEQSKANFFQIIAAIATSVPSKALLGACAFISNYFGFFYIMENGKNLTLDILYRKNPLFRNLNYTQAEERIIASIRTLKNFTGLLYENGRFNQLEGLLGTLLPGKAIPSLVDATVPELETLLSSLKESLASGELIKNMIKQYFVTTIHEDNKIPSRSLPRQYGQYGLGIVGGTIATAGLSNFITLSAPSLEQLCFNLTNCTMGYAGQITVGIMDYIPMTMLALTVYHLGYHLAAPRYQSTVGNISNTREAYIISTCVLGGAPNILQALLAKQVSAIIAVIIFVFGAEAASFLIEYDGFKNIEKQQFLESLKISDPKLWFIASVLDIKEEIIQKISDMSPEELEVFHQEYNTQSNKTLNRHTSFDDQFKLPKSKYGCGLPFWDRQPNTSPQEYSRLIVNSDDDDIENNSDGSSNPQKWNCNIQ